MNFVNYIWPDNLPKDPDLWLDYEPTKSALEANMARIQERMPVKVRFTAHK